MGETEKDLQRKDGRTIHERKTTGTDPALMEIY